MSSSGIHSPRATNPELWGCGAFTALRHVCRFGATVHTYSGATSVRAALLLSGFVAGIGPRVTEGKTVTEGALGGSLSQPLDRRRLARLTRSSAPLPADAPGDALARIAALPQFAVS